jgi:hypothetical protein
LSATGGIDFDDHEHAVARRRRSGVERHVERQGGGRAVAEAAALIGFAVARTLCIARPGLEVVWTGGDRAAPQARVEARTKADEGVAFVAPVDRRQRRNGVLQRAIRLDLVGTLKVVRLADRKARRDDRRRHAVLVDRADLMRERNGLPNRIAGLDERIAIRDAAVLGGLLPCLGGDRDENADRDAPWRDDRSGPT